MPPPELDAAFVERAIRRRDLFARLSAVGVIAGLALLAWSLWTWRQGGGAPWGTRFALAILVLLNARQNLRQVRYADALRALLERGPR